MYDVNDLVEIISWLLTPGILVLMSVLVGLLLVLIVIQVVRHV